MATLPQITFWSCRKWMLSGSLMLRQTPPKKLSYHPSPIPSLIILTLEAYFKDTIPKKIQKTYPIMNINIAWFTSRTRGWSPKFPTSRVPSIWNLLCIYRGDETLLNYIRIIRSQHKPLTRIPSWTNQDFNGSCYSRVLLIIPVAHEWNLDSTYETITKRRCSQDGLPVNGWKYTGKWGYFISMSGVISPYTYNCFFGHFSGAFFGLGVLLGLNYGARMLGFKGGLCFPKAKNGCVS